MHIPTVLSGMKNNFRSFWGTSEMYPGISEMELLLWGRMLKLFRVLIGPGASLGLVHRLLSAKAEPTEGRYSLREAACFLTLTSCLAKGSFREAATWPRLWLGMILLTRGSHTPSGMYKHILTNAPWGHQRGGSRCGGWGIWGGGGGGATASWYRAGLHGPRAEGQQMHSYQGRSSCADRNMCQEVIQTRNCECQHCHLPALGPCLFVSCSLSMNFI